MEALDDSHIKVVSMITEGVPEKDAKLLVPMPVSLVRCSMVHPPSALSQPAPVGWASLVVPSTTCSFQAVSRRLVRCYYEVGWSLQRDHLDLLPVRRRYHHGHRYWR